MGVVRRAPASSLNALRETSGFERGVQCDADGRALPAVRSRRGSRASIATALSTRAGVLVDSRWCRRGLDVKPVRRRSAWRLTRTDAHSLSPTLAPRCTTRRRRQGDRRRTHAHRGRLRAEVHNHSAYIMKCCHAGTADTTDAQLGIPGPAADASTSSVRVLPQSDRRSCWTYWWQIRAEVSAGLQFITPRHRTRECRSFA